MNTFLRASGAIGALLWTLSGAAALQLPVSGDCRVMSAQAARQEVWMGRFSGTYDDLFDQRRMIAVNGCFYSEYECRRWINGVQTAVTNPGLMTCGRLLPN